LKSPQAAAKQAERTAKEAEQLRQEKRKSRVMLIGLALVSISLVVADYFWLKAQAQKRREEHRQRQHQRAQTNSPAVAPSISQTNRTNHE
jgi:flagellar basal body-associated protein FliL